MEYLNYLRFQIYCSGCGNLGISGCGRYALPFAQHTRIGGCAMDTRKSQLIKDDFKLNPLKASKRGMK